MVISDLVTDKEVQKESIDSEKWCSCIDGALTRDNYIKSIKKAGFQNPKILKEKLYIQEEEREEADQVDDSSSRRINSIIVKAVKE